MRLPESSNARFSRRTFARLAMLAGPAAAFATSAAAWPHPEPLPPAPTEPSEGFWESVRKQFVLDPDLTVMLAANLCPSSAPVLETLYSATRLVDRDPSHQNREKMAEGKEAARKTLAEFLRVSPEEIVITRNTSEANNLVSSGIDLKPGDEVIVLSDNHPSNLAAWSEKGKRFGFTVKTVDQVNPHPGGAYYIEAITRMMTQRTKVLAFTHLTSTVGDLFPAAELCEIAHQRGVLTLIDGAQSFGLMDVDLSRIQPDFYTGSAHKWPCGSKETGVLYVNRRSHSRLWPTIYSAFPGAVGISRTLEAMGQRDEPAIIAFGEALRFQTKIGRKAIETRARELAQALSAGLKKLDGVRIWTHPDPERSVAVVSFQPAGLDPQKLAAALYAKERIACSVRSGKDRPGLRFCPHLYNTHAEVDRVLATLKRYLATGV